MLSLTKLLQTTKVFLHPRLGASLQSANFSQSVEEKLGLPQRPKKPLTPYFRFLTVVRPQVVKDNPGAKAIDAVRICAKKWETVDEGMKQKLTEEYLKEKQDYVQLIAKYEKTLTDDQRAEIQNAKQDAEDIKEKRAFRKKNREFEKPKKPASGFLRFQTENLANKASDEKFRDFQKRIVQVWKDLSEEKKNAYNQACRDQLVAYKQELAKWELKMVRMGNVDLVRQEALIDNEERRPIRKSAGRPKHE